MRTCQCGCGQATFNQFVHGHNGRKGFAVIDRFRRRVRRTNSHWFWIGGRKSATSYGRLMIDGKNVLAHRLAWELFRGSIPPDLVIDHICGVKYCVNPDHLRLVSMRTNAIENSPGPIAINAAKKSCIKGHDFSKANTYRYGPNKSQRRCRKCHATRERKRAAQ